MKRIEEHVVTAWVTGAVIVQGVIDAVKAAHEQFWRGYDDLPDWDYPLLETEAAEEVLESSPAVDPQRAVGDVSVSDRCAGVDRPDPAGSRHSPGAPGSGPSNLFPCPNCGEMLICPGAHN